MQKLFKNITRKQNIISPKFQYSQGSISHLNLRIKPEQILNLPSTPAISPSYPTGPYRFINREWFIIPYVTDGEALRKVVPYPLTPNKDNIVLYEWINMPDSTGFGDYAESGIVIPCLFEGKEINYTYQMYLDCEPPIAAGREIWGFPKKFGEPKLSTIRDTLVGTLDYRGQQVAMGTMAYKYKQLDHNQVVQGLKKDACNLKIIPDVTGKPKICQIVGYNLEDINLKGAWEGPARLDLFSHVRAPTGDLPIKYVLDGKHIIADITLPYGRILYDHMQNNDKVSRATYKKFKGTNFYKIDTFEKEENVLQIPSMPHSSPMYLNENTEVKREILSFRYLTCPEVIAKNLPEPLVPHENPIVLLVFNRSDGTDGEYTKVDVNIPCYFENELVIYNVMSFVDQSSNRTENREKYGQPLKLGFPKMEIIKDTLLAKLQYSEQDVVTATMAYKFEEEFSHDFKETMKIPIVQLKFIPGCEEGSVAIAQLTRMTYDDVTINKVYKGPCRITMKSHVNAPIKDLPVHKVLNGYHIDAEYTIRKGQVLYDYLEESKKKNKQEN